ncbi:hypothetical protein DICPUDRAFT_98143 [Dictyostelium purpureum]|uniref:Rho-GAP domain-containing protein n=1 Tax=Dictyostelium purpureum TaxID=5786 RepID=F0ZN22_DICPU|nr:uncharacterized protein DICPUDRAFT_98143 [Dictyostelium purpureum]EGC34665.1 hypothetical protein DICPUDRAFT_98143 [Dictyostelium purpureum]|eukprot:XP_003288802.1 hypothetical protein DICPUDRAFT_98143 [Dictyostelium purpureum]
MTNNLFSKKPLNSIENNNLLSQGVLYCWGEKFTNKPTFNSLIPNICYLDNGLNHSLALNENGELYGWGDNRYCQLGSKTSEQIVVTPIKIKIPVVGNQQSLKIRSISCGGNFSAAILENGLLYTWGLLNEGGKIIETPTKVDLLKNVTSVSIGMNHCAVVADSQTPEKKSVYCWGINRKGQLGVVGDSITNAPRRVTLGSKAITVCCGDEFTAAIVEGNEVFVWGNNKGRQICNNSDDIISIPAKPFLGRDVVELSCSKNYIAARSGVGNVCIWGSNDTVCKLGESDKWITFPNKIKQISASINHLLALSEKGEVFNWGLSETEPTSGKKTLQYQLINQLEGRNVISVYAWNRTSGAIIEPGNFKVEIAESMRRKDNINAPAPLFVRKLVNFIRGENTRAEGLFRLSGSMARLDDLERKLDSNEMFSMSKFEPFDAADIIKRYLKTLPEPLLLNNLCQRYEKDILNTSDQNQREQMIMEWIAKLPKDNRQLLIYLLSFLEEISISQIKYQKSNAMSQKNLALVFAPNILTKGEIGNDDIVEDMIKMLPAIMKQYPEMEELNIIDQAQQCLRGSRISYIIDHWVRITRERDTANKALFKPEIIKTIINSIVECTLELKNQSPRDSNNNLLANVNSNNNNTIGGSGTNQLSLSTSSLSSSRDNNFCNNSNNSNQNSPLTGSSPNLSPTILTRSSYSLSFSGVSSSPAPISHQSTGSGSSLNLLNLSGGAIAAAAAKQNPSPQLIGSPSLSFSNSSGNLIENTRLYEQVLALILSPIIPIKSIMKVLPSIFELETNNDLFIRLLTTIKLVRTINLNMDEEICDQMAKVKEINSCSQFVGSIRSLNEHVEHIISDILYCDESINYWKQLSPSIQLYTQQILSYFKWWNDLLEKSNSDTEEKLFRVKKEFDKLETEKSKLEKQLNHLNSVTLETSDESIVLKKQFDQWCLLNQIEVTCRKIEASNIQLQSMNQQFINIQSQLESFKPHLAIVQEFVTTTQKSLSLYIEKLESTKSSILTIFPQFFNLYIELIFTHHHEIKLQSQHIPIIKALATSITAQHHLLFIENLNQSKYQISLELETKFFSLKRLILENLKDSR